MPAKAPLRVLAKPQAAGAPAKPTRPATSVMIDPPVPPTTVLIITREIMTMSPSWVMWPKEPPLKARKPTIMSSPPRPVICGQNDNIIRQLEHIMQENIIARKYLEIFCLNVSN